MPTVSKRGGVDERASLLTPDILPLFDDTFVRSCDLYEEYIFRLTCRVFVRSGLAEACGTPATAQEAVERAGFDPHVAVVPVDWMLRLLALRRRVATDRLTDQTRYTRVDGAPDLDPEDLRLEQERHDPKALPSYTIAAHAAEQYPAVLRGETTGERALFSAERTADWADYFSNGNAFYAISNKLAAVAAAGVLPQEPASVLELGGGLGSGAEALCDRLAVSQRSGSAVAYRFTELTIPFLRRAQRTLDGRWPGITFGFSRLDMDRPFAEAGVDPGSFSLVYAVNALHVANDLAFTLREIRGALQPGGTLVAGECLRPFPHQPIYVEFVFNLLEAFRHPHIVPTWRPNGGFLTPEQWTAALHAGGFREVRLVPDIAAIRCAYPSFVIAAIVARST